MEDMEELERMIMSGRNDNLKEALNRVEIEQVQMMAWNFFSAYQMGDTQRAIRIFHIIKYIAQTKRELPSLQDYFRGRRIGRFKNTITMPEAARYVAVVSSEIKKLTDWRVKPVPMT